MTYVICGTLADFRNYWQRLTKEETYQTQLVTDETFLEKLKPTDQIVMIGSWYRNKELKAIWTRVANSGIPVRYWMTRP